MTKYIHNCKQNINREPLTELQTEDNNYPGSDRKSLKTVYVYDCCQTLFDKERLKENIKFNDIEVIEG